LYSYSPRSEKQQGKTCRPLRKLWLGLFFFREDFSTTFTDSSSCSILSKASSLSSRRVLVKLQLLKNQLKLLPVATRQTFPCKYTFLTDSDVSLWLFNSVNHETFLEFHFSKINNIFPASHRLLTKNYPKNVFGNFQAHVKLIIIKRKWHKFFTREVLIGCFQEHTLN